MGNEYFTIQNELTKDKVKKLIQPPKDYTAILPHEIVPSEPSNDIEAILAQPRNFMYIDAIQKGDILSDIDKQIIETQQEKLQKEINESKSKAAENSTENSKSKEKESENDQLIAILVTCYIPGCIVHTIDKYGNIIRHFRESELPSNRISKGYEVWKSHKNSIIEIYENHITVVGNAKTIVINE